MRRDQAARQRPETGIHADRVAGGHRHHRRPGRPAPARRAGGARGGAAGPVRQQPEADRPCPPQLRRHATRPSRPATSRTSMPGQRYRPRLGLGRDAAATVRADAPLQRHQLQPGDRGPGQLHEPVGQREQLPLPVRPDGHRRTGRSTATPPPGPPSRTSARSPRRTTSACTAIGEPGPTATASSSATARSALRDITDGTAQTLAVGERSHRLGEATWVGSVTDAIMFPTDNDNIGRYVTETSSGMVLGHAGEGVGPGRPPGRRQPVLQPPLGRRGELPLRRRARVLPEIDDELSDLPGPGHPCRRRGRVGRFLNIHRGDTP